MRDNRKGSEFHFLGIEDDISKDEFLRRRLAYLRDYFSYNNLSGLSVDELNNQSEFYNAVIKVTLSEFMNKDSVFADKPILAKWATDDECDLYEPLTQSQENQIHSVCNEVQRNFDKAYEDARDRRFDRLGTFMNSLPMVSRLKRNA